MADLFRTFGTSGESESKAVPDGTIEVPPSITPVMEFCRPLARASVAGATTPRDESFSRGIFLNQPAGAGYSNALYTLKRGVWRLSFQASLACTGAAPVATNYAVLALVGPDAIYGGGINIVMPDGPNVSMQAAADFLVHLPTDEWQIALEVTDPVTALAVNRFRGSLVACHLL